MNIAEVASFIDDGCPFYKRSTKYVIASVFPITCLLISRADNDKIAAAALLLVCMVPDFKESIINVISFSSSTKALLLLSSNERFRTAVIRFSWSSGSIQATPGDNGLSNF